MVPRKANHNTPQKFGLFLLSMLFTACSGSTFMHEYHDVNLWGWNAEDTVAFDLPPITSTGEVEAEIGVRFTDSYRYNDLRLLGTLACDGTVVRADTILVQIFQENGTTEGEGFPYTTITGPATSFQADSGHVYSYKVTHLMTQMPVKGIAGIGLRLTSRTE